MRQIFRPDFLATPTNQTDFIKNQNALNSNILKVPAFTNVKISKVNYGNFFTLKSFTVDLYETVSLKVRFVAS